MEDSQFVIFFKLNWRKKINDENEIFSVIFIDFQFNLNFDEKLRRNFLFSQNFMNEKMIRNDKVKRMYLMSLKISMRKLSSRNIFSTRGV